MPAVLVRNISLETHSALKQRAQRHGHSTGAEIRLILDQAAREEPRVGLGTMLEEITKEYGGYDLHIERDETPREGSIFE